MRMTLCRTFQGAIIHPRRRGGRRVARACGALLILLAPLVLLLAGCVSTQSYVGQASTPAPSQGNARITVIRESAFAGGGSALALFDNGAAVGELANGGRFSWDRPAGPATLTARLAAGGNSSAPIFVDAAAGSSYTVAFKVRGGLTRASIEGSIEASSGYAAATPGVGLPSQPQPIKFKVGDEEFLTRAAAEQRVSELLAEVIDSVPAVPTPLGRRAIVAIPTRANAERNGIQVQGDLSREQIDYLVSYTMSVNRSMFDALKKRGIFSNVVLVENASPEATPLGQNDVLVYLHNPSPKLFGWYMRCKGWAKPRPLIMDTAIATGTPRTMAWLDGIEEMARASYQQNEASVALQSQTNAPHTGKTNNVLGIRQRWAVVIGISKYEYAGKGGLEALPFAERDATDIAAALQTCGWKNDHVKLLVDEAATERNVRVGLESWLTKAAPNDLILLYWAGHGFPDPEDPEKVYFACYDTDVTIPATGYRMDQVVRALQERKARNVVFLADACHAGKVATRGSRGMSIIPEVDSMQKTRAIPRGWIYMLSSDTDRKAVEHSAWEHGAFTYCLLKGLAGEADGCQPPAKKDGIVTMGELRDFLGEYMPDETHKALGVALHPVIITSSGDSAIWNLPIKRSAR